MSKGLLRLSLAAALAAALAGCGDAGQQRLTLTGSSTVAPVAGELADAFEKRRDDVRIDVQAGGSSRGIADARQGLADAGMASRALTEDEAQALQTHTIARDGIAIILHRDNPVESLTREQIRAIYTGGVERWAELGGPDRPITVINKAAGRATLEVFLDEMDLEASQIDADVVVGHNQQAIKTLGGDPTAIAYVSIGAATRQREHGTPLKLLPLDGVAATAENVARGAYPMTRPLNLVTRGEPSPLLRAFIDFARQDDEGRRIVREQLYVPVAR